MPRLPPQTRLEILESKLLLGKVQQLGINLVQPERAGAAKDSSKTSLLHTYVVVDGDTTHSASPFPLIAHAATSLRNASVIEFVC